MVTLNLGCLVCFIIRAIKLKALVKAIVLVGVPLVVVVYFRHQFPDERPYNLLYNFHSDSECFLHLPSFGVPDPQPVHLFHEGVDPDELAPGEHPGFLDQSVQAVHGLQKPLLFQRLVPLLQGRRRVGLPVFLQLNGVEPALTCSISQDLVELSDGEFFEAAEACGYFDIFVDSVLFGGRS